LDAKAQLEAAARHADARIAVARTHLAQVRAGAKASEIAAQQAEVERIQMELDNARKEHQRYVSLGDNVTASQVDALRLRVEATTRAMTTARERLTSLTEVRPVDVEVAEMQLAEAVRNHERARAELNASVVRSPIDGRVIKINAWPSEQVDTQGLLELAPAAPMYVVAEVAESDISRVRVGQRATISADALPSAVEGTVERIGATVLRNERVSPEPASFSDSRVVNVWIRVNDGAAVTNLIDLQVDVILDP
jgi:HlyD family secretion protein